MSNDWDSDRRSFDAHLGRRNAERLQLASVYFTAVMLALIVAELIVPELRSAEPIIIQFVSILYFSALAWFCRKGDAARWPTPALPLLFGIGAIATGLLLSLYIGSRFGANPAYATTVFVACLAPLWPRRALLAMLVPLHGVYLVTVFAGPYDIVFRTIMTVGGTVVLPLGVAAAILAFRGECQAFGDMAAIRTLLDERRDMVAMVAHDLQSPLAGIRALLRTMDGGSEADALKLAEIARSCGDMYGAVASLVDAHRHAAAERLNLADVQVETLFEDARARAAAVAAEKEITIIADSPPLAVTAEPSLLSAMIGNLLGNAIKYSPKGSVVRLTAEPRAADVRLGVVDSGPGIPADEIPLLFKKFSRLRAQSTGSGAAPEPGTESSTGLGLYIVRTLADRMGAHVGFAPNPGGGSIFFIDLPRPRGA